MGRRRRNDRLVVYPANGGVLAAFCHLDGRISLDVAKRPGNKVDVILTLTPAEAAELLRWLASQGVA